MDDVFKEAFTSPDELVKCKNDLKCLWIRRSLSVTEAESCTNDASNENTSKQNMDTKSRTA